MAPEAPQQHYPGRHHHLRAYLAFLKSNMDISEYWRVLSEGSIDRAAESYERPILAEPTPGPTKKVALIKDFQNYLKILKSVHSSADLIECIKTANKGLGGVSPARQLREGRAERRRRRHQLLAACRREARAPRRGSRQPLRPGVDSRAPHLDLSLDDVARRAAERSGEANQLEDQMRLAGLTRRTSRSPSRRPTDTSSRSSSGAGSRSAPRR